MQHYFALFEVANRSRDPRVRVTVRVRVRVTVRVRVRGWVS